MRLRTVCTAIGDAVGAHRPCRKSKPVITDVDY
jgi:hypothetical protein